MRVMRRHDLTSDQPKDHDKDKDNEKHNDKYIYRTPSKTAPRDLWPLRFLIRVMRRYNLTNKKRMTKTITMKKTKTMRIEEHPQRAIVETCDLWETDYIFGNWEQQSQHSQWPLNKEWQGQHSQFLRCFACGLKVSWWEGHLFVLQCASKPPNCLFVGSFFVCFLVEGFLMRRSSACFAMRKQASGLGSIVALLILAVDIMQFVYAICWQAAA